ncbi:uncharacterized protein B0T15DRAFT_512298 [Chaetomium strumarium]|uniref:Uncharacterized protein n=1 Tax=Chaetomium strumarium TaxID=1170767 RepID=A0AAJ0M052_9PEZI|nr:hypothetical protein B0T15DRAFT_512298 [Chaetomium strumarium]
MGRLASKLVRGASLPELIVANLASLRSFLQRSARRPPYPEEEGIELPELSSTGVALPHPAPAKLSIRRFPVANTPSSRRFRRRLSRHAPSVEEEGIELSELSELASIGVALPPRPSPSSPPDPACGFRPSTSTFTGPPRVHKPPPEPPPEPSPVNIFGISDDPGNWADLEVETEDDPEPPRSKIGNFLSALGNRLRKRPGHPRIAHHLRKLQGIATTRHPYPNNHKLFNFDTKPLLCRLFHPPDANREYRAELRRRLYDQMADALCLELCGIGPWAPVSCGDFFQWVAPRGPHGRPLGRWAHETAYLPRGSCESALRGDDPLDTAAFPDQTASPFFPVYARPLSSSQPGPACGGSINGTAAGSALLTPSCPSETATIRRTATGSVLLAPSRPDDTSAKRRTAAGRDFARNPPEAHVPPIHTSVVGRKHLSGKEGTRHQWSRPFRHPASSKAWVRRKRPSRRSRSNQLLVGLPSALPSIPEEGLADMLMQQIYDLQDQMLSDTNS